MSAEMENSFLVPKLERTSILQVGFEPGPKLNDALHRFLLPGNEHRRFVFRTLTGRRIPFDQSDNDGIVYDRETASRLHRDRQILASLAFSSIPIANAEVNEAHEQSDIEIILGIKPARKDREKLLGTFVLGGADSERQYDEDAPLGVRLRISHLSLAQPRKEVAKAALMLQHDLGMFSRNKLGEPIPSALYLTKPHITERTGDMRIARDSRQER